MAKGRTVIEYATWIQWFLWWLYVEYPIKTISLFEYYIIIGKVQGVFEKLCISIM